MVYRFIYIGIFLCALVSPIDAEAKPIKSIGGMSLGNFDSDKIQRSEAKITVDIEDKHIKEIVAGTLGRANYREYWKFKSGYLLINSVSGTGRGYNRITQSEILKLFNANQNNSNQFLVTKEKKLRSNIFYILFKNTSSNKNCAVITAFWGDTDDGTKLGDAYGRIVICDPEGERNPTDSLNEALYILGNMKYDDNKLRLGYKFPSKREVENLGGIFSASLPTSSTPSKIAPPNLDNNSDSYICRLATRNGFWEKSSAYQNYVNEAKKRGLSCDVRIEKNNGPLKSSNNELENYERKCTELGFTKSTEKYGDCVMKLYK